MSWNLQPEVLNVGPLISAVTSRGQSLAEKFATWSAQEPRPSWEGFSMITALEILKFCPFVIFLICTGFSIGFFFFSKHCIWISFSRRRCWPLSPFGNRKEIAYIQGNKTWSPRAIIWKSVEYSGHWIVFWETSPQINPLLERTPSLTNFSSLFNLRCSLCRHTEPS